MYSVENLAADNLAGNHFVGSYLINYQLLRCNSSVFFMKLRLTGSGSMPHSVGAIQINSFTARTVHSSLFQVV